MPKTEDWMSPLNRIVWLRAFRTKKKVVQLRDGRKFSVDYNQIPGKAWVCIMGGPTHPCGWFDLYRVTDELFLTEQANSKGTVNMFQQVADGY